MLTDYQQARSLIYPLFQSDFGEPGDRVLSDRIVVARKAGACVECLQPIEPGQHARRHVAVYGGDVRTYRYCEPCCAAMALSWEDDGQALEARWAMRARQEGGA